MYWRGIEARPPCWDVSDKPMGLGSNNFFLIQCALHYTNCYVNIHNVYTDSVNTSVNRWQPHAKSQLIPQIAHRTKTNCLWKSLWLIWIMHGRVRRSVQISNTNYYDLTDTKTQIRTVIVYVRNNQINGPRWNRVRISRITIYGAYSWYCEGPLFSNLLFSQPRKKKIQPKNVV